MTAKQDSVDFFFFVCVPQNTIFQRRVVNPIMATAILSSYHHLGFASRAYNYINTTTFDGD